jgi:tRNA 2-thiouridine synthesizing protein E
MLAIEIDGRTIDTDDEGYLVDPADWNEAIAGELARRENLQLGPLHWQVIEFMRRYLDQRQIAPDARYVIRHLAEEVGLGEEARAKLFELFPYGYVRQACKIAGMRRPRAWSTG